MVRKKWAEMGAEEKEVWIDLARKGKKEKPGNAREKTGLAGEGKKQETLGHGGKLKSVTSSSGSSKGTKLVITPVKKATNAKKTVHASTPRPLINSVPNPESSDNNLLICNKDITSASKATNTSSGTFVNKIEATEVGFNYEHYW